MCLLLKATLKLKKKKEKNANNLTKTLLKKTCKFW